MALAPRLELRTSQALVMTPQLQQAIKLLTLSNLELDAVLADEMAKNPLLERDGAEGEVAALGLRERPAGADELISGGLAGAEAHLDVDLSAETFHHVSGSDALPDRGEPAYEPTEWRDHHIGEGSDFFTAPGSGGASDEGIDFDSFGAPDLTLRDHLTAQAGEVLSGPDHAIALALIEGIDDAGYLDVDLTELAERLGIDRAHVEQVLGVVQRFNPTGVGARDLAECLAIQAKEADRYDPCMAHLIDNLPMLAKGQLGPLRKRCGVDDEDLGDMIRELRAYDPKPGLRFARGDATPVVPDLFVTRTRVGWAVEINGATLPRLLVNRRYYSEMATRAGKGAPRAWLGDALASANWLVKALDQRQRTIIKVAEEIVRQQQGFFESGVCALKPLTLAKVADAIGMHESTVSRVTSNKYLSCARGLFELKYFFSSGVGSADGDGASAQAVKDRIARLIAGEGEAILSDDQLVTKLRGEGFDLARRTVAKYREALGLGSSVQRRRARAIRG